MPVAQSQFRYAVPLSGTYVLRVVTDTATTDVNIGPFDPYTDYFMLGDESASDALGFLAAGIESHADIASCSVQVSVDGEVTVDVTYTGGATTTNLQWSHANTTADATVWGWFAATDSGVFTATHTAPCVPMGLMPTIGGRPVTGDSRPRRRVIGGVTKSLSGLTRGARWAEYNERRLSVDLLLQDYALDEYAPTTAPYATFESMFVRSLSLGRAMHYIPDVLDPGTYSVLRLGEWPEGPEHGLTRSDAFILRWSWSLSFVSTVDADVSSYVSGRSYDLDGSGDYLEFGDLADFDGATAATWSMWVRYDALGTGSEHWAKGSGGATPECFFFQVNASNDEINTNLHTGASYSHRQHGPFTPAINTWYHIVYVFDGTQGTALDRMRVYVNGALLGAAGGPGTNPAALRSGTTSPLRLGAGVGGLTNDNINGVVDEPAVWVGHAASAAQVTELYNGGRPTDLNDYSGGLPLIWLRADGDTLPTLTNHGTGVDATAVGNIVLSTVTPP